MAGKFKGANKATLSESGTKCSDGTHILEIKRITYSEEGQNGEYFVVEYKVVESDSGVNPANGKQIDAPGDERSWTQNMSKAVFPFPKLLAFTYAAMGYDSKNAQDKAAFEATVQPQFEDILDGMQDESDPLSFVGRRVKAVTKGITTKKGHPFVEYKFSPGQADKLSLE